MKVGIRKPSVKKSIKARTTGKAKRAIKKSVNPVYGKKGMGMVNNPKKAIYNKVYSKATISARDAVKYATGTGSESRTTSTGSGSTNNAKTLYYVGLSERYTMNELISKRKTYLIIALISFAIYCMGVIMHKNEICPFFSIITIIFGVLTWRRNKAIKYTTRKKEGVKNG